MRLMYCPSCNVVLTSSEASRGRCDACGSPVGRPSHDGFRDADASPAFRDSGIEDVRPWTPSQIFGVSFAFGSAAGGIIAAINFSRMGKTAATIPMAAASVLIFLIQAAIIVFMVPPEGQRLVGLLINSALGLAYMLVQKPEFDAWKKLVWQDHDYKPNGLGLLFLVSLLCLAAEFAVIVGFIMASGQA
ncbi:MAG: hypothetical protein U0744_20750 [Gemmataceae bacterium]